MRKTAGRAARIAICGTAVACAGRGSAAAPAPASVQDGVTGTYEVVVCRGGCAGRSPTREVARGVIVIEPDGYAASDLPEPARGYATGEGAALTLVTARGRPNACFVLRAAPGAASLAGSAPVGFTTWTAESGGGFRVKLAQTADAGYLASVSVGDGRLRGTGREWGPDAADSLPPDSVVGRRVGAPDRGACVAAAERAAVAAAAYDSVAAAMVPTSDQTGTGPAGVAGTYRVELCATPCAGRGRAPAVRGRLVLEETTYSFASLPEPVRRLVTRESRWQVLSWGGRMNACFVPDPGARAALGSTVPVSFLRWVRLDGVGTVGAWLYQTASSGYAARFTVAGDTLRGTGRAVTRLPFDDPRPLDALRATRVGPPDRGLCIRAGEGVAR